MFFICFDIANLQVIYYFSKALYRKDVTDRPICMLEPDNEVSVVDLLGLNIKVVIFHTY